MMTSFRWIYFFSGFGCQSFEYYFWKMERNSDVKLPNRLQISEVGHDFLQRLPGELDKLRSGNEAGRPNSTGYSFSLQRKGRALDFYSFANQTQHHLKRQIFSLQRLQNQQNEFTEQKRKVKLHHEHWLSQQKLVTHKVADAQAKLQQNKYSDYDWRGVGMNLKKSADSILSQWQESSEGRNQRTRAKLKRLLIRKYPGRS